MKIQIRLRQFVIDRYSCVDTWSEPIAVSDKVLQCGDMTTFYRGRYPAFSKGSNEWRIVK